MARPLIRRPKVLAPFAFAVLVLAACAQQPRPRATEPAIVGPAPAASSSEASPGTGLAPAGVAATPLPGGGQWTKPGTGSAAYRADLESCYAYAQAQVAHDERIESDSGAAFDAFPSGLGVAEFSGRMNRFERKNRRTSLYNECMRAKGYREQ